MIIGIAGAKGGGKTEVAEYLVKCMPWLRKVSFADPMKHMLQAGLKLTDAQLWGDEKEVVDPRYGVTPRWMLQSLGTEWGRDLIKRDIWVRALEALIGDDAVIVDDVRNVPGAIEVEFIRANGVLLHIEGRTLYGGEHGTEKHPGVHFGDMLIDNSGSKEDLHRSLAPAVEAFTNWR